MWSDILYNTPPLALHTDLCISLLAVFYLTFLTINKQTKQWQTKLTSTEFS